MPSEIDYEAITECSANHSSSGPSRSHRDSRMQRCLYQCASLLGIAWKSDRQWLDLIQGSVRRVQLTAHVVEGNRTSRTGKERLLLRGSHRHLQELIDRATALQP